MRKMKTALCMATLVALLALVPQLQGMLPADRQALIEKKYAGWSGVLRLWALPGWETGSGGIAGWLNLCVVTFEKAHPGVYIQADTVDAATLSGWNDGSMPLPDLLLFPPGALESPAGLLPLEVPDSLRPELHRCGQWEGTCFALPIMLGGYALASAGAGSPVMSEDGPFSALLAMLAMAEAPDAVAATPEPSGIDLGLPASAFLPEETAHISASAWRDFANGGAAALLTTQRDLRRLEALANQGKGPDWALQSVAPFTDQLLCVCAAVTGDAQRQALAIGFAESLLTDAHQRELHRIGAFSVTEEPSGYGAGDSLAILDAGLRSTALVTPRAFGGGWRPAAQSIVREYLDGPGNPKLLWAELRKMLP